MAARAKRLEGFRPAALAVPSRAPPSLRRSSSAAPSSSQSTPKNGAAAIWLRASTVGSLSPKGIHTPKTALPRISLANKACKRREIAKILPPSKIGDFYDFGSVIGRGGFGVVSEILHVRTFQAFAGKVVRKTEFEEDKDDERRWRAVTELFLNHEHPNVVRLLHAFEDEDYYLVMEKCEGGTLGRFVRAFSQPLPTQALEDISEQILSALSFHHSLRLVHRDVKPENVMLLEGVEPQEVLSGARRVKLQVVDLDMCEFLDDRNNRHVSRLLSGTPGFLAPEVIERNVYTPMSDFFAFGVLLYTVLSQQRPCQNLSINAPTQELVGSVDRWLEEALSLCERTAAGVAVFASPRAAELAELFMPAPAIPARQCPTTASLDLAEIIPARRLPATASPDNFPPRSSSSSGGSSPSDPRTASPKLVKTGATICFFSRGGASRPPSAGQRGAARIWRLAAWCLERDPERRPASVAAIAAAGFVMHKAVCLSVPPAAPTAPTTAARGARRQRAKSLADIRIPIAAAALRAASPGTSSPQNSSPSTPTLAAPGKMRQRRTSIDDLLRLGAASQPRRCGRSVTSAG